VENNGVDLSWLPEKLSSFLIDEVLWLCIGCRSRESVCTEDTAELQDHFCILGWRTMV